jgi:outer membrane receptor protein involved in Fe transport
VARTANAVDIRNTGLELLAVRRTSRFEVVLGYAWLEKHGDYGSASVDASFYALNFPRHRLTAAATWRLGAGFEVRSDNEFRMQEDNPLRTAGGDSALLSSLGLYYAPPDLPGWQFSLLADNLWQSEFQEVPAVPAARRQWAVGVTRRW